MKKLLVMTACLSLSVPVCALAGKSCDQLKSEIASKLDAKGVIAYTLTIIADEDLKDEQVVGSCEAGTSKITYERSAAKTHAAKPAKPSTSAPTANKKAGTHP